MNIDFSAIAGKLLDSGTIKGVVLSLAFTAFGFVAKEAVQEFKVKTAIEDHTKAIADLKTGQDTTHAQLEGIAVTLTQFGGKLDVLNQKIDDDRERRNWNERHINEPRSRR